MIVRLFPQPLVLPCLDGKALVSPPLLCFGLGCFRHKLRSTSTPQVCSGAVMHHVSTKSYHASDPISDLNSFLRAGILEDICG